jgi:hypothetical protein
MPAAKNLLEYALGVAKSSVPTVFVQVAPGVKWQYEHSSFTGML